MNAPLKKKPKAQFSWEDPFLLEQQLTEDERMVREAAAAYCKDKLEPRVLQAFREEKADTAVFREMGELGLLGPTIPAEYGGPGLNYVCYGLIARELATLARKSVKELILAKKKSIKITAKQLEDFLGRIAVVALRALVPGQNALLQVLADDRVLDRALQDVVEEVLGFRELARDPLRIGHVAGGREHAQHMAGRVPVQRRVVEHVGQLAIGVTHRQGVVLDEALGEDLLVALARPRWFREVIRKIRADELVPRHAGDRD